MARPKSDPKTSSLKSRGCLHPHPERVLDEAFATHPFFDARDLIQVKYEMLRRVRVDHRPAGESARLFGLSRPSYYAALKAYESHGLAGLLPVKPGPRGPHKLTGAVLTALREAAVGEPPPTARELAALAAERFGVRVHPRSVERALARQAKKSLR